MKVRWPFAVLALVLLAVLLVGRIEGTGGIVLVAAILVCLVISGAPSFGGGSS